MSIKLQHVSFGYIKQPLLLTDVNIDKSSGSLFVFGQTGAGKTSLLELMCGMQDLYVGKIEVCGKVPKEAINNITYLPEKVVAFENKSVLYNLQYACDAIGKSYDCIDLNDEFIKEFASIKFKKLSAYNRAIFAFKRAEIKDAKVLLIDVNLQDFSIEEISKYGKVLNDILIKNNKILVIAISAEDLKKLQICMQKSEICYLFATKVQKFNNFIDFENNVNLMGMAEYLALKKYPARLVLNQNGYFVKMHNCTFKIKEEYVKCVEKYFDETTSETDLFIFTNEDIENNIDDKKFNELINSGEVLVYDRLSTERLI